MFIFPSPYGVGATQNNKETIAVTNASGQKKVKSFQTKNKIVFWHFPFARGLQFFLFGLIEFAKILISSFDFCFEKEKKQKWSLKEFTLLAVTIVFAVALSAILFGFLPARLGLLIVGYQTSALLRNFVIMLIKLVVFYAFLLALRLIPQLREMFCFNLAIEKSQNAPNGNSKRTKKLQRQPNFLNFLIFVFLLDFVVITLCGISIGIFWNFLVHLAILILCISFGYEIVLLTSNFCNFLNAVSNFLVFSRPTKTHFEMVEVVIAEMNMLKKGRDFMEDKDKIAFSVLYTEVKNKLAAAGILDKSDADWIIANVLQKTRGEIKLVSAVTEKQYQDIIKATDRRAKGESVDNIFGFAEFYGIRFDVNKKVLTPRMETEILVEQVLKAEKNYKKCEILDVGTGSGAIAIALAKNCDARITAVDVSKAALAVAESNAKKNDAKIEFLHSNLFDGLKRKRKFDIIVSNPPYIPSKEIEKLDKNVRECDPILALDGGEDGLDFYRAIVSQAKNRLKAKGQIFFEIGKGQAAAVRKLLRENGFEEIKTTKDYNKIERIVSGRVK